MTVTVSRNDEMWYDDPDSGWGCPCLDGEPPCEVPCEVRAVPYGLTVSAGTQEDAERVMASIRGFIPDYQP